MSVNELSLVADSERLLDAMGQWPSFHDSRLLTVDRDGDCIRVAIHVFRMTDRIDGRGYYVPADHHLVKLEMSGVSACTLPPGYTGDTLDGLAVSRVGGDTEVAFDSACDPNDSWRARCQRLRIVDVYPCTTNGERLI